MIKKLISTAILSAVVMLTVGASRNLEATTPQTSIPIEATAKVDDPTAGLHAPAMLFTPDCNLQWLSDSAGWAHGGEAWCPTATWWQVVVYCSNRPFGTAQYRVYGYRNSRWESQAYCPAYAFYAVKVTALHGGPR